jgi:hypothetical protein
MSPCDTSTSGACANSVRQASPTSGFRSRKRNLITPRLSGAAQVRRTLSSAARLGAKPGLVRCNSSLGGAYLAFRILSPIAQSRSRSSLRGPSSNVGLPEHTSTAAFSLVAMVNVTSGRSKPRRSVPQNCPDVGRACSASRRRAAISLPDSVALPFSNGPSSLRHSIEAVAVSSSPKKTASSLRPQMESTNTASCTHCLGAALAPQPTARRTRRAPGVFRVSLMRPPNTLIDRTPKQDSTTRRRGLPAVWSGAGVRNLFLKDDFARRRRPQGPARSSQIGLRERAHRQRLEDRMLASG